MLKIGWSYLYSVLTPHKQTASIFHKRPVFWQRLWTSDWSSGGIFGVRLIQLNRFEEAWARERCHLRAVSPGHHVPLELDSVFQLWTTDTVMFEVKQEVKVCLVIIDRPWSGCGRLSVGHTRGVETHWTQQVRGSFGRPDFWEKYFSLLCRRVSRRRRIEISLYCDITCWLSHQSLHGWIEREYSDKFQNPDMRATILFWWYHLERVQSWRGGGATCQSWHLMFPVKQYRPSHDQNNNLKQ